MVKSNALKNQAKENQSLLLLLCVLISTFIFWKINRCSCDSQGGSARELYTSDRRYFSTKPPSSGTRKSNDEGDVQPSNIITESVFVSGNQNLS